jgi:uncharacterized Zn finger protein
LNSNDSFNHSFEEKFEEKWEHFFKPEVRSGGRSYFAKGSVRSSQPSDTEVVAYISGSSSAKITFKSESVSSEVVTVDCSCPASQKGQFCKHIWATLLKIESSHADFLDGKEDIMKASSDSDSETESKSAPKPRPRSQFRPEQKPLSEAQIASQEALKAKQSDYRKQQYQKQKQRFKEQKQAQKKTKLPAVPEYPADVQAALNFFSENGFALEGTLNPESIRLAKKRLSRVFHPDIGGSHGEIVVLNEKAETLIRFFSSQKSNENKP